MSLKSQILWNCVALLNHPLQKQTVRQFHQFQFRPIPTTFHRHLRPTPPPLFRPHLFNMSSQASPDPPSDSTVPIKTVKVVASGRVQRVHYRDWTVQNATELGLKGWVKNRGDGSVEILLSGEADKVDEMQERCRTGPPLCVVTKFQSFPSTEDPGIGFQRLQSY
ncbi:hypothetical protein Lser_V15G28334 [Lactuca serriola]